MLTYAKRVTPIPAAMILLQWSLFVVVRNAGIWKRKFSSMIGSLFCGGGSFSLDQGSRFLTHFQAEKMSLDCFAWKVVSFTKLGNSWKAEVYFPPFGTAGNLAQALSHTSPNSELDPWLQKQKCFHKASLHFRVPPQDSLTLPVFGSLLVFGCFLDKGRSISDS